MSVPITATHRLTLPVTVLGVVHKIRVYCNLTPSGDVTGFDAQARIAPNDPLSLAIDAWLTAMSPLYNSAQAAFGTVLIEQYVAPIYNIVGTYLSAVVTSSATATRPCIGVYMSMRDTGFHRVKQYILDTYAGGPSKAVSHVAFDAAFDAWVNAFTTPGAPATHKPYRWVVGRSGLFIASWISLVSADNDKQRRVRGLA